MNAIAIEKHPPFSLSANRDANPQISHAPREQRSHPHHGRSDGLIGMARILPTGCAVEQLTGLHVGTILSLMVTAGEKCQRLLDTTIRGLRPHLLQADELHSIVGCHGKRRKPDSPREWGSTWTWLALDSESKLIIAHYIGGRDANGAWMLMRDLRARTEGTFQLTSDGLKHYRDAVDAHFATSIHFAQLVKLYSMPDILGPSDWFSASSRVTGTIPSVRCGRPEPRFVSTSHVERLNLSVRTHLAVMYAGRTPSRKLENHKAVFALWVAWYNFVRLNSAVRMTPAMAAGVTDTIWTMRDLLGTSI